MVAFEGRIGLVMECPWGGIGGGGFGMGWARRLCFLTELSQPML